jgi:ornithine decarboxylase
MEDAFYVLDLGLLVRLFQGWVQSMPRVRPFYAVKCSPDRVLLTTLAALGAGFDCASKAEISQVLDLGVATDRIVFANPCKMQSHVAYAASVGVNLTTFDSESEVHKVKAHHPGAVLLLRIRTDDRGARCPLGVKYGALMHEVEHLLRVADNLHVPVAGNHPSPICLHERPSGEQFLCLLE